MNEKIVTLTSDNFDSEVLNADGPVLVDFWAPWCGPCKMVAPLLDEAADEFDGKATIAKLNIDDHGDIAPKFGIRGIPTMLMFKDGAVVGSKVGAISKQQLVGFLNENI